MTSCPNLQNLSLRKDEQEAEVEQLAKQKIELQKQLNNLRRDNTTATDQQKQQSIPQADRGATWCLYFGTENWNGVRDLHLDQVLHKLLWSV